MVDNINTMQQDSTENAVPCGKIGVIRVDKSNSKLVNIDVEDVVVGDPLCGGPGKRTTEATTIVAKIQQTPLVSPTPFTLVLHLFQIYSHKVALLPKSAT